VLKNARHPMVERYLERRSASSSLEPKEDDHVTGSTKFIPNDVLLRCNFGERRCEIVTGPNMGGKSSYVRMVAIISIMGQVGACVPADR
jgi:DNA mismatch repair ATPase MutS